MDTLDSAPEAIYNVFLYVDANDCIDAVGIVVHKAAGSDQEKLAFLQARVATDHENAQRFAVSPPVPVDRYPAWSRLGQHRLMLEPLFQHVEASAEPLQVVTFIVNGEPRIHSTADVNRLGPSVSSLGSVMDDYLVKYVSNDTFDLPRLIDDDYIDAVRLLFNNRKYVSAAKLIVSCIDTLAFIEYGDIPRNFQQWVDEYVNLAALGVTSTELWEFRNAVLHMTSVESRNVMKGGVARLFPCVAPAGTARPELNSAAFKLLELQALIRECGEAVARWAQTYNEQPGKFVEFVQRYDLIISEARLGELTEPFVR